MKDEIFKNLMAVNQDIKTLAQKSGRNACDIKLCAVSKFHPAQDVLDAISAGQKLFGENRVQEAEEKFTQVNELLPNQAELHIIGSLQRNKIKKAVKIASCIQSVDRLEVLSDIERHASELGKKIQIMFEVHTGEESKAGIKSKDELWSLLEAVAKNDFPHVQVTGLMTMAPFTEDEKLIHKSFATLRELEQSANRDFPPLAMTELSMGMSGDYKIAIEEGSTMVRIGTAIFGQREAKAFQ